MLFLGESSKTKQSHARPSLGVTLGATLAVEEWVTVVSAVEATVAMTVAVARVARAAVTLEGAEMVQK